MGHSDGAYVFETSLGMRMEVEAALAYLLVPPVGGVALLVFEHKSDYVRLVVFSARERMLGFFCCLSVFPPCVEGLAACARDEDVDFATCADFVGIGFTLGRAVWSSLLRLCCISSSRGRAS